METLVDLPKINQVLHNAKQRFSLTDSTGALWYACPSSKKAEHELRVYRFFKKFSIHDPDVQADLTRTARRQYESFDRRLDDMWFSTETSKHIQANADVFRRARLYISQVLVHFKVKPEDYDFGPGESYITSQGDVSILAKLATHEWTVTRDCAEMFLEALYLNRATRRIAWCRFDDLVKSSGARIKRLKRDTQCNGLSYFKAHIVHVLKFVNGNRFSTVDKDNSKRRPICVEPLGNIYVQKGIGNALKRALTFVGIDLYQGQEIHKKAIVDFTKATIDFSNASDSIHVLLCKLLFPSWFFSKLSRARSPVCEIDKGIFVRLNKLSSMGNGFTFEVLTLLLWCFAKAVGDESPLVYGDDVIIHNNYVEKFIRVVTPLGFMVNEAKSFSGNSCVRESCGAFVHRTLITDDYGNTIERVKYLLSFDFTEAKNDVEAIALINKLFLLRDDPTFGDIWLKCVDHVHEDVRGPVPYSLQAIDLDKYVFFPDYKPKTTASTQWIAKMYQLEESDLHLVKSPKIEMLYYDWKGILHPNMINSVERKGRVARVTDLTWSALRLKNRMEPIAHIRQNSEDMNIIYQSLIVGPNGPIMTARQYKALRSAERNYISDIFGIKPTDVRKEHWNAWHLTLG